MATATGTSRKTTSTFTNWIPSSNGFQQDKSNGVGTMATTGPVAQDAIVQTSPGGFNRVTAPPSAAVAIGSAINPGVTGAQAAKATGVGLSGPQNAASVLGTLQNKAVGGFGSTTSSLTSAKTQKLLSNPSADFNPDQYAVQQKDVFASNQAKALESARQAGANVANTGLQQNTQQSQMLQSALDRANYGSTLDLSMAEKKKTDMQQALAEGRATTATEQAGYDTGIAALATARQAGEGEADRAVNVSQADLDRQLAKETQSLNLNDADKERILKAATFNSQQQYDKWALQQGMSEADANRTWQDLQATKDRAWKSTEASADRQIEMLGLAQGDAKLAQEALAAGDKPSYAAWAKTKGYSPAQIDDAWNNRESALDRAHEVQMQQMADENGQVGQVMQGLMMAAEQDPANAPMLMAMIDKLALDNKVDLKKYLADAKTNQFDTFQRSAKVSAPNETFYINSGSNASDDLYATDSKGNVYNVWGEVSRYKLGNQYLTPAEYAKIDSSEVGLPDIFRDSGVTSFSSFNNTNNTVPMGDYILTTKPTAKYKYNGRYYDINGKQV
jgi:hypothetical protein